MKPDGSGGIVKEVWLGNKMIILERKNWLKRGTHTFEGKYILIVEGDTIEGEDRRGNIHA